MDQKILDALKKINEKLGGTNDPNEKWGTLLQEIAENIDGGGGGGSSLPSVTSADNGDVLTVVEGEWAKEHPNIDPNAFMDLTVTYNSELSRYEVDATYSEIIAAYNEAESNTVNVRINEGYGTPYGGVYKVDLVEPGSITDDPDIKLNKVEPDNQLTYNRYGNAESITLEVETFTIYYDNHVSRGSNDFGPINMEGYDSGGVFVVNVEDDPNHEGEHRLDKTYEEIINAANPNNGIPKPVFIRFVNFPSENTGNGVQFCIPFLIKLIYTTYYIYCMRRVNDESEDCIAFTCKAVYEHPSTYVPFDPQ